MSDSTPMAETTSAPSLRELSERATPGPWTAGTPGHGSVYGVYSDDRTGSIIGMFQHCYVFHRSHEQMIANAQFTARLETDYRAGRLIDPTTLTEAVAAARAEGWQPIETAPRDRIRVIVAVPSLHADQPMIVGEAYFNPDHEDGTWWWAGTTYGDYYAGPIHDTNAPPTHWQLLPAPPTTPGGRTDG